MERTHGTGSVYQLPDGRWRAAVELPRKRGESRKRRTFTGPTRAEVEERLATYRSDTPTREARKEPRHLARTNAPGHHTDSEWWALVREKARRCHYCGIECSPYAPDQYEPHALTRDHRTPLARGGSDDLANIAVSCRSCNCDKGTMTEAEYMEWRTTRGTR